VNLSMEKNMGKGYFIIKMEVTIRGILKIIWFKVMENISIKIIIGKVVG
jgi:hypothetical protein